MAEQEQVPQAAKTALWNAHIAYQGVRPQSESEWIDALLAAVVPLVRKKTLAEVEEALAKPQAFLSAGEEAVIHGAWNRALATLTQQPQVEEEAEHRTHSAAKADQKLEAQLAEDETAPVVPGLPTEDGQPQVPSGPLGDEERERLLEFIDELRDLCPESADRRFDDQLDLLRKLAERPAGDAGIAERALKEGIESVRLIAAKLADASDADWAVGTAQNYIEKCLAEMESALADRPAGDAEGLREWLRSDEAADVAAEAMAAPHPLAEWSSEGQALLRRNADQALAALTDKAPSGDREGEGQ